MPSLEVPSANSTTASPVKSRSPISLVAAPVRCRAWRSMKMVRCSFDRKPNTGQFATSLLATNTTGPSAEITQMSSQETWLAESAPARPARARPLA